MNNIPDKNIIDQVLERICSHSLFAKSPRNIRLLKFLVEKAFANCDVKEQLIGIELFGGNFDIDKNDGKVRVYMYNLRKKLDEYYEQEGKDDAIVFVIEKGQYNLHFKENEHSTSAHSKQHNDGSGLGLMNQKGIRFILIAAVCVILAFIAFKFVFNTQSYPCWNQFMDAEAKNICVVSDHFIISESKGKGRWHAYHINGINQEDDLFKYSNEHKDKRFKAADYTMLTKMGPLTIYDLTKWFVGNKSDFDVRLESEMRMEDYKENNIVFVGQFKTMTNSKSLFLRNSKVFTTMNDGFVYSDAAIEKLYTTKFNAPERTEYAMVSYMALDNGTNAMFFCSNNDIGAMATVRQFTDKEWLKGFYDSMPSDAQYFNALFEVSGIKRTDMSCKLVELELVE